MPGTVDDFMNRFAGGQTVTDQDASQLHDRFMSDQPGDRQFDKQTYASAATEYLGKLPDDQFHQAAASAMAKAPPEERHGMLTSILQSLSGGGGSSSAPVAAGQSTLSGIASMLGLTSADPRQMNQDDAARVMNYARTQQPAALQQAVADKPWFLKALGNPMVMGALAMAATKMISSRSSA